MPDDPMRITLYIHDKPTNSTLQPSVGDAHKNKNCILKDATSLMNPVIDIAWDSVLEDGPPVCYNYCYLTKFYRYYYIKDWVSVRNGLWRAYLTVDVLATWKKQIGFQECYILRSASKCNPAIIDTTYPATTKVTTSTEIARKVDFSYHAWDIDTPWRPLYETGMYVLGILNSDSGNANGAVNYYMFTPSQFNTFKSILLGDASYAAGDFSGIEISQGLWKSLFNPIQYISTCKWYPISPSDTGLDYTEISTLKFGWWELPNCHCYKLNSLTWDTGTFCFRPPTHPQAFVNDTNIPLPRQFMNFTPYTEAVLHIPPFGTFQVNLNELGYKEYSGNSLRLMRYLRCNIRVDLISGMGSLIVTVYERDPVNPSEHDVMLSTMFITTTNIAVNIVIGQISNDALGIAGGFVETVTGAASLLSGNPIGALTAIGGVMNALQASIPTAQQYGSSGTIVDYQTTIFNIEYIYHHIVDVAPDEFGYPYYKSERIDHFSGYIKTANAYITTVDNIIGDNAATHDELELIRTYMNGGFFYE